jgi:hypothetical protein
VNPRLDRALRIAAGVLGLIVAVPVLLAMLFLVVLAWARDEASVWILVPPLAILGAALVIFGVRALRPALATFRSLAILGALELAVVVFLLAASRPITGGTVTGAVISAVAAGVAFWAASRARLARNQPVADAQIRRKPGPISISVRRPVDSGPGSKPQAGQKPGQAKRKK